MLVGPLRESEGILTADLDLGQIVRGKFDLDVVGHHARPDVFELVVDRTPHNPVTWRASEEEAARGGANGRDDLIGEVETRAQTEPESRPGPRSRALIADSDANETLLDDLRRSASLLPTWRCALIIRVFRARPKPGHSADELARMAREVTIPGLDSEPGLVARYAGTGLGETGNEFTVISVWADFDALKSTTGDDWERPLWPDPRAKRTHRGGIHAPLRSDRLKACIGCDMDENEARRLLEMVRRAPRDPVGALARVSGDDVIGAVAWLRDNDSADEALELAARLQPWWLVSGESKTGREILAELLSRPETIGAASRVRALWAAGELTFRAS